jgi:hypothetical protein
MQSEVDETWIGHGEATEKRVAILTPLNSRQKQKAAEAAFCLKPTPESTRKPPEGQAVVVAD